MAHRGARPAIVETVRALKEGWAESPDGPVAEEAPEALGPSLGDFFGCSPSSDLRASPPS